MKSRTSAGFTLMELMAVIAIIGIMAAMLLPSLALAREKARRASCLVNLSNIGMAMHMYADEHERELPWSGGNNSADCLKYFFPRYGLWEEHFICPSDANNGLRQMDEDTSSDLVTTRLDRSLSLRASYEYFGAYTAQPITLPPVSALGFPKMAIMWDKVAANPGDNNHVSGLNVVWLDGSVSTVSYGSLNSRSLPYVPEGTEFSWPPLAELETSEAEGHLAAGEAARPPRGASTSIPVPPPPPPPGQHPIPPIRLR